MFTVKWNALPNVAFPAATPPCRCFLPPLKNAADLAGTFAMIAAQRPNIIIAIVSCYRVLPVKASAAAGLSESAYYYVTH